MKVVRLMSVREFEAYKKGKTIRPIRDCRNAEANTMGEHNKPMVCFAGANDYFYVKEYLVNGDPSHPEVFVCFEMNAKYLYKGTGYYAGKPQVEYYAECYNKRNTKMLWHYKAL